MLTYVNISDETSKGPPQDPPGTLPGPSRDPPRSDLEPNLGRLGQVPGFKKCGFPIGKRHFCLYRRFHVIKNYHQRFFSRKRRGEQKYRFPIGKPYFSRPPAPQDGHGWAQDRHGNPKTDPRMLPKGPQDGPRALFLSLLFLSLFLFPFPFFLYSLSFSLSFSLSLALFYSFS